MRVSQNEIPAIAVLSIFSCFAILGLLLLLCLLLAWFPFLIRPLLFFIVIKELVTINNETLLSCIQNVLDERVKPVKGKIGMQRQRFRAVKLGVDLMLDVCRRTHNDLETEMEGKCFFSFT